MTWSPKGDQLATLGKDHFVRIFEPRSSLSSIVQLRGPEGSRGARIVWLEADIIAVSGFTKYLNKNYLCIIVISAFVCVGLVCGQ